MKCQATKTYWINRGRENSVYALILYHNEDEECFCHEVMFRGNMSRDYTELEENGYTIIEEIFL